MSLSVNYIFLLIFFAIAMIGSTGYFMIAGNPINLLVSIPVLSTLLYFVYNTGIQYGQYGLEIMIAKLFMKRKLVNDFPILRKNVLNTSILKSTDLSIDKSK